LAGTLSSLCGICHVYPLINIFYYEGENFSDI